MQAGTRGTVHDVLEPDSKLLKWRNGSILDHRPDELRWGANHRRPLSLGKRHIPSTFIRWLWPSPTTGSLQPAAPARAVAAPAAAPHLPPVRTGITTELLFAGVPVKTTTNTVTASGPR